MTKPFTSLPRDLGKLPGRVRAGIRPAMTKLGTDGQKRLKNSIRSRVRATRKPGNRWKSTGALARSVGKTRVKKLKSNPEALFVAFGVKTGQERPDNRANVKRKDRGPGGVSTSRYAHLVEFGHGGPVVTARPYPVLKPLARKFKGQAQRAIREALRKVTQK